MSRKFSDDMASPGSLSDTNESNTTADMILNKRMLPIVSSSMNSPKYRPDGHFGVFTPSSKLAVDVGRVHTHADMNDNYSSKNKRPAVTISSSQPQSFRKKKVGFDAEQCGFLRINDIILTISGNVTKTYEQLAANPERSALIKELAFAKIKNQEKCVNWNQLKKLRAPKEKTNGYVSEALATYLQVIENPETRRQPIDKQVHDLDIIIRDDNSSLSFMSEASSVNSATQKATPVTGPTGLWRELKKKGFKEVKHSKSLFEMLVPDGVLGESNNDLKTRRKSAMDPESMFDNDESVESTVDSVLAPSILSEASAAEQKSDTGKRVGQKKCVTIVEKDGTVHSPSSHRLLHVNEAWEDTDTPLPVILISPPSGGFRMTPSQSSSLTMTSIISRSDSEHVSRSVSPSGRRAAIVAIQPEWKTMSSRTSSLGPTNDDSYDASDNNNSSNFSSGRISRSRSRHKNEATMHHRSQGQSSINATRQTGGKCASLSSSNLEADVVLLRWQLLQAGVDIESLRRENHRLKRKMILQRTNTESSHQKPHGPSSMFYGHCRGIITIFSCLTAIVIGMILGKLII